MDIQNIKRKRFPRGQPKSLLLTIRVTPALSEWLKKNDYSPTGVFYEAVKDLGFKE